MLKGAVYFCERLSYRGIKFLKRPRIPIQRTSERFLCKLQQVVAPSRRPGVDDSNCLPTVFNYGQRASQLFEVVGSDAIARLRLAAAFLHLRFLLSLAEVGFTIHPIICNTS